MLVQGVLPMAALPFRTLCHFILCISLCLFTAFLYRFPLLFISRDGVALCTCNHATLVKAYNVLYASETNHHTCIPESCKL